MKREEYIKKLEEILRLQSDEHGDYIARLDNGNLLFDGTIPVEALYQLHLEGVRELVNEIYDNELLFGLKDFKDHIIKRTEGKA